MTGLFKGIGGAMLLLVGIVPTLRAETFIKQVNHTPAFVMMGQERPEEVDTTTMWFADGKAVSQDGSNTATLYLAAEAKIYVINHAAKEYSIVDFEADKPDTPEGQPNDEQKMAQAMMGQIDVVVTPTEETAKIDAWETTKYEVDISMSFMKISQEVWATEDLDVDLELYQYLSAGMLARLPGFAGMVEDLKQIKGIPVKSVSAAEAMGMTITTTTTLIEVGEAKAPHGLWGVPSGYKEVEMSGHGF